MRCGSIPRSATWATDRLLEYRSSVDVRAAQETEWGVFPSDFYLNPPISGPPGGDPGPGVGGGPAPDPDHDDDDKDEEDEEEEDKEEDKEKDDEDEDKDDKEGAGGGGASGGAGPGFPDHVRPAPPDPLELEPCQDRELATRKCRQLATIRGCPKTYYCVASGPACEVQVDCLEDVIRWAAPGRRVELR